MNHTIKAERISTLASLNRCAAAIGIGFFLLLGCLGCGSKTPPVAPQAAAMAPVQDLQADVHTDILQLNWGGQNRQQPDSYMVYCWKRSADDAACNDCPAMFVKVGEVLVPSKAPPDSGRMTFEIPLQAGYRYTCRVVAHSAETGFGVPSNEVTVTH